MTAPVLTVEDRYGPDAAKKFRADGNWKDDSLTEWIDHWAQTTPTHRAVTDGYSELDYRTVRRQAYRLARWMRAQGVRSGDRVAVQLPNWNEFLVVYLAASRIGAITIPIMLVYRHDEVGHILTNSGAVLAVTTGEFRGFNHAAMFRELQSDAPGLASLLLVRESPLDGETAYASIVDSDDGQPESGVDLGAHPDADIGHVVIYSSGTESRAKGCLHTWNTLAFTSRALSYDVFKMTPADTMWMPSPVTHSTGIVIGLVTPILSGASIHLQDVWVPEEGLRRIQEYGCTITATATPFVAGALDAAATHPEYDLSSMRAWLCAGAPIPGALARKFEATFTNARLLPLYGCTEILSATVCRLEDTIETISSTDGKPTNKAVRIKIVGEDGKDLEVGEVGEIIYSGPGAILGYWNEPEKTAAAIDPDGWHHTGDLGVLNDAGYLRVTGRAKDIIIRGGQNLSAGEIEEHLLAHHSIRNVAVAAYPDDALGERVCAFIVPNPGAQPTLEDLRDFLVNERKISIRKAPEKLMIVDELPMTATGKVQKYLLRNWVRESMGVTT